MPTRLPVPLFGAIAGLSRDGAYAIVRRGDIICETRSGTLYVPFHEAERLVGLISPERLCAALRSLEARSTAPALRADKAVASIPPDGPARTDKPTARARGDFREQRLPAA